MNKCDGAIPAISVVMSVYNGEKFLIEAIESILNQTFSDFEFIIINDGSTDESLKIIEEYVLRDFRIRLISRVNKGLIPSLNEGVANARGEWIARMDADDISLPDRFEKQLAWLKKTQADICGGWIKLIGSRPHKVRRYYESDEAIKLSLLFGPAFAHPTIMLRTCLAKANPYCEESLYVEDYELWTRLGKLGAKMTNYPAVILRYRIHPMQITALKEQQQRENLVNIFKQYATSCFGVNVANDAGYLLVADKTRPVSEAGFYEATAFLNGLVAQYADPQGVVSTSAFVFFTRCAKNGPIKLMQAAYGFKLRPQQILILLFLSMMRVDAKSSFYKFLYRMR
jgi:glycosyltransferase involved in cell wall biosynthesis